MAHGIVKWFDAQQGVGDIMSDDGDAEVAVRHSEIDGGGHQSLRAGDRVTFTVEASSMGPRAAGVYS